MMNNKQYKLPKKIVEPWLEALRSGKYKQGQEYLFRDYVDNENGDSIKGEYYCCLGVLGQINSCTLYPFSETVLAELDSDMINNLPQELLHAKTPLVDKLIHMNDSENKSFKQIADWIEENCELTE